MINVENADEACCVCPGDRADYITLAMIAPRPLAYGGSPEYKMVNVENADEACCVCLDDRADYITLAMIAP